MNYWAINNGVKLPFIPDYASNNGHIFYMVCKSINQRDQIIRYLKEKGIYAVFHYLSLHKSDYCKSTSGENNLPFSDMYSDRLVRLPLFYELTSDNIEFILKTINSF